MKQKVIISLKKGIVVFLSFCLMICFYACDNKGDTAKSESNAQLESRITMVEEQLNSIQDLLVEIANKDTQAGGTTDQTGTNNNSVIEDKNQATPNNGKVEQGTNNNQPNTTDNTSSNGANGGSSSQGNGATTKNETLGTTNSQSSANSNNSANGSNQTGSNQTANGSNQTGSNQTGNAANNSISVTSDGVDVNFDQYLADINALEADINSGKITNADTYHKFKLRVNELETKLDIIDDNLEMYYQQGKLSKTQYASLDGELDVLEDKLDRIEDRLEQQFGIDD